MFRVSQHPLSGVLKTVTAASGTGHNIGTATSLQRGPIGPRWRMELQFYPDPARKLSATCMPYTIAVCTVKNS